MHFRITRISHGNFPLGFYPNGSIFKSLPLHIGLITNCYPPIYSTDKIGGSNFHTANFKASIMYEQKSFAHIWSNLYNHNNNHTSMYTPVTHGEPPSHGTKACGGMQYTSIIYNVRVVSWYHSQSNFGFVVHSVQHFPYLRNLFEPKSLIIFTIQVWTVRLI